MIVYEFIRVGPGIYVKTARQQAVLPNDELSFQARIVRLAKTTTPKTSS